MISAVEWPLVRRVLLRTASLILAMLFVRGHLMARSNPRHQRLVRNRVEVSLDVRVHDPWVAVLQPLVAACMLQRPDLFGAVVCGVPVADMLRYHKFTVGRYWIPEYGSAEASLEQFKTLYAYSPLHNVKAGAAYPPILVTTADTDDRVAPLHGKKFAATLQAAGGKNPVLLRVETKAGHGQGKPTSKQIAEQSDVYAFLFKALDVGSP